MRILVYVLAMAAAGCGGGPADVKVKPLTDEEKRKLDAQDKALDDEERSGSGTAVAGKKVKRR